MQIANKPDSSVTRSLREEELSLLLVLLCIVQDNHVFLFIGPQEQEQDVTQLGDRDAKAIW